MSRVVIIGCGYVGKRLAQAEMARGNAVCAISHQDDSARALRALGLEVIQADLDKPQSLRTLDLSGVGLYYLAPPPAQGEIDSRILNLVENLPPDKTPARIVAISTTGVYGDCRGDWVDETRPLAPVAERAKRRVHMEQTLSRWALKAGASSIILRVPGIYGPGRLPIARIRAAIPVLAEADSPYSNRIHVDDLVNALLAAADNGKAGDVFNVADGHPSTMTDYFNQVADASGLPRPPQITRAEAEQELSEGMLSYLAESKRIDISRMSRDLGVVLSYPTLADGLKACAPIEPDVP